MTIWANIMAGFAVAVSVTILGWFAYMFRPNRARNVKYAERVLTTEHFVRVQRSHPEIVKVARLDRHPWFYVVHICILGYTISVLSGARLTSNVLTLGDEARYTMATCFLVGSTLVLIGVVLGLKVGPWRLGQGTHNHATASVLGDDIALPYRLEMAGMFAIAVSSGIYSWTSFQFTTGSFGGWLSLGVALLCTSSISIWYRAVAAFQQWDHTLITEAMARLEAGSDGSH